MSILHAWAQKWAIPSSAVEDLMTMFVAGGDYAPPVRRDGTTHSESYQQSLVRLEASKLGIVLTRNNVGALFDRTGRLVRYGLWNETPQQNKSIKSGDLIGIKPYRVTPMDIGRIIGQFTMREMKEEGWKYNPNDEHENAQLACINLVNGLGGDAAFATGPGSFIGTNRNAQDH